MSRLSMSRLSMSRLSMSGWIRGGVMCAWLGALASCSPASDSPHLPAPPAPVTTQVQPGGLASAGAVLSSDSSVPQAVASAPAFPSDDAPARTFDLHLDTPWQVKFKGRSVDLSEGQGAIDAVVRGQYGGLVYPIYIADHLHKGHPTIRDAEEIFDTVDAILARHEAVLWPATKGPPPADKIVAYVSIEGAGAFAEDIKQIDRFIERGVVLVGPVHAADNRLATSATGKNKEAGLSKLGKEFCERVYDRGALVDVSHMSDRAFDDLAAIAEQKGRPIVATHSNARAIANHPRNLPDAALRRIAKSGGVVGLNLHHTFVRAGGGASLADVVKQAKYLVEVLGIDHVAIGSDFDGATPPEELKDASTMPKLAAALREAGMSAADVHKIFSENAKRILAQTRPAPTPR